MDKNTLIYYFLVLRAKIKNLVNAILVYLFSVKNITVIDKKSKLINITGRYYVIQLLKHMIYLLNEFINLIDIECNTVQIVKRTQSRDIKSIQYKNCIRDININNLNDIIKHKNIITKLELHDNDKKTCIKNIMNLYNDSDTHTINNIFIFNNIYFSNDATVFVQYFKQGKMIKNTYNIEDIKNRHIRFIYDKN